MVKRPKKGKKSSFSFPDRLDGCFGFPLVDIPSGFRSTLIRFYSVLPMFPGFVTGFTECKYGQYESLVRSR